MPSLSKFLRPKLMKLFLANNVPGLLSELYKGVKNVDEFNVEYGPLPRSKETEKLEELFRFMILSKTAGDPKIEIVTEGNPLEYIVNVRPKRGEAPPPYNLSALLKNADNLNQVMLTEEDMETYESFTAKNGPSKQKPKKPELKPNDPNPEYPDDAYFKSRDKEHALSHLSYAEKIGVNIYTSDFYEPMNALLRGSVKPVQGTADSEEAENIIEEAILAIQKYGKETQDKEVLEGVLADIYDAIDILPKILSRSSEEPLTQREQSILENAKFFLSSVQKKILIEQQKEYESLQKAEKIINVALNRAKVEAEQSLIQEALIHSVMSASGLNKMQDVPIEHALRVESVSDLLPGQIKGMRKRLDKRILLAEAGQGSEITVEQGFVSASTGMKSGSFNEICILFTDHSQHSKLKDAPKKKTGLMGKSIKALSVYPEEREFLMPPTKILWKKHKEKDGIHYFHAVPVSTPQAETTDELRLEALNVKKVLLSVKHIEILYKDKGWKIHQSKKRENQIAELVLEANLLLEKDILSPMLKLEKIEKKLQEVLQAINAEMEHRSKNKFLGFSASSKSRLKETIEKIQPEIAKIKENFNQRKNKLKK